jgi:hypothetical protein
MRVRGALEVLRVERYVRKDGREGWVIVGVAPGSDYPEPVAVSVPEVDGLRVGDVVELEGRVRRVRRSDGWGWEVGGWRVVEEA